MAWSVYQLFLAGLMLVTGSINTLSTKWADSSNGTASQLGPLYADKRKFDHPFLQSVGMFIGELSCLLVFKIAYFTWKRKTERGEEPSNGLTKLATGNQFFNPLIFWPAALCDMCGTTLMYIGLNMTDASSFQMLRGAVIIFTALLSVAFLQRTITNKMWLGILFVVLGLAVVGLADILTPSTSGGEYSDVNKVITGDLIILIAQIIAASQMVYEERFVYRYNVAPLQAVGWEGFFGFVTLSVLLVPMYFIKVGPGGTFITSDPEYRLENTVDAFYQMGSNPQIIVAQVGNILSIAFFNFSGISVTRELSATTRMVLDSLRTIVVWVVSVNIWDPFNPLQIPGFVLLAFGTAVYNGLLDNVWRKIRLRCSGSSVEEREPLIN